MANVSWWQRAYTVFKLRVIAARLGMPVDELKEALYRVHPLLDEPSVSLCFRNLGGKNNLGMFLHLGHSAKPLAISKLMDRSMAQREYRLLQWQSSADAADIAPAVVDCRELSEDVSVLTTRFAETPVPFEVEHMLRLHQQLGSFQAPANTDWSGVNRELQPTTPIKALLCGFVTETDQARMAQFLDKYLSQQLSYGERAAIRSSIEPAMAWLVAYWPTLQTAPHWGLVHGDFKRQNILQDDLSSTYLGIDLEYYCHGLRVWDLAFFYSRGNYTVADMLQHTGYSGELANVLVCCYLIASLSHYKKKREPQQLATRIEPAADWLQQAFSNTAA